MILRYDFERTIDYEYEADEKKVKDVIVALLVEYAKDNYKGIFNEDGAYQMAMYVVHGIDVLDGLKDYFKDELMDYFYNDAYEAYEEDCRQAKYDQDMYDTWYETKNDVIGF